MEADNNKSFIDRHPNVTSIVSVIVWFVVIALMWVFTSCKGSQNYVEIVKWDTLHVYHTDTIHDVHNDTIREKVVVTVHDSIIKQTIITNVVNEQGDVVHTEKETNNEVWHNADTNTSFIQHTVDSLLQAKMDSIYHSVDNNEMVVVEKQKSWWEKFTDWVKRPFLFIGIVVVIGAIIWFAWKTK